MNGHTEPSPELMTLESMNQALWYNRWTFAKFEQFLKHPILEVGCGIGNFTSTLASYGHVTAIDSNQEFIRYARTKATRNVRYIPADIQVASVIHGIADHATVVCMNVLEHIPDDHQALDHMIRVLRPGGHLILLVPIHRFLYGAIDRAISHQRRYEEKILISTLQTMPLTIVYRRRINFLGALGWFVTSVLLKRNTVSTSGIRLFNALAPVLLPWENLFEPPIATSSLIIARKLGRT